LVDAGLRQLAEIGRQRILDGGVVAAQVFAHGEKLQPPVDHAGQGETGIGAADIAHSRQGRRAPQGR
jgi:hypothetical protein